MTKSSYLISVIVAAYNIEEYLPCCLDSLAAQTYERIQIIVVDDGSTDGTSQICDSYGEKYSNITVIHQENKGLSAARNAGLALAEGDYIGYVDGDDWVEPDMYRALLSACLEKKADIAICTYRQMGEGADEIHPTGNVVELDRKEALEIYISGHPQYHIYNSVWSKLFKKEVVRNIRFREGRKSEDIMYTTIALTEAPKCVFLDTPYYNYRTGREGSIMSSGLSERRFQDEIPFWKEQIDYLSHKGFAELSGKATYQFYRRMLFYYIDFRNRKMKSSGKKLFQMLKGERENIRKIYGNDYVASGDKARMKLFLFAPGVYYYTVMLYDRIIIPLRQ